MDKESLLKLITLYRQKEALWNLNSPAYKWMEVKREAIEEIAEEMGMTVEDTRKKIRSLRGTYVQEKTKIERGKKSRGKTKAYVSSLWWYEEMKFLDECIIRRKSPIPPTENAANEANKPDIFDSFCKSVNCQLRALSENDAFAAMDKIQKILAIAKIEILEREGSTVNSDEEYEQQTSNASNNSYNDFEDKVDYLSETEEFPDAKPPIEYIESIETINTCTEMEKNEKLSSESADEIKAGSFEDETPPDHEDKYVPLQPKSTRFTTKERKYKCPICGYAGTDRSNMLAHIQRHSKNKPHKCDECGKSFHTKTELTIHIRYHTGERPFLCTLCGNAFATSSQLCIHIKRHNNNKDKVCHICQKRFYELKNLREHLNIHSENREYVCTQCNASFKQKMCLKNHIKLHENKFNYQCQLCDSKFNQRSGLHSHMRTNHTALSASKSVLL